MMARNFFPPAKETIFTWPEFKQCRRRESIDTVFVLHPNPNKLFEREKHCSFNSHLLLLLQSPMVRHIRTPPLSSFVRFLPYAAAADVKPPVGRGGGAEAKDTHTHTGPRGEGKGGEIRVAWWIFKKLHMRIKWYLFSPNIGFWCDLWQISHWNECIKKAAFSTVPYETVINLNSLLAQQIPFNMLTFFLLEIFFLSQALTPLNAFFKVSCVIFWRFSFNVRRIYFLNYLASLERKVISYAKRQAIIVHCPTICVQKQPSTVHCIIVVHWVTLRTNCKDKSPQFWHFPPCAKVKSSS